MEDINIISRIIKILLHLEGKYLELGVEELKKTVLFLLVFTILLVQLPMAVTAGTTTDTKTAKVSHDGFVDITLTTDDKKFVVHSLTKSFSVAPYINQGQLFVQIDQILPWIGYKVNFDNKTGLMTASNGTSNLSLKDKSLQYKVNGKEFKFTKAPKIVSNKLTVPVSDVFKSLGYEVTYNSKTKTTKILKSTDIGIGGFTFFNKQINLPNFFTVDKKGIYSDMLSNTEIKDIYSQEGAIILYVYDQALRQNKLVKRENGKFVDLKQNFDIVDTYIFGGCRVFYGYDNSDKKYKLYRFTGNNLSLVVGDCYSSVQVNFKDSIILNKYDSNRNYTIVKIDPKWNVRQLYTNMTMTEYYITDDWLYMKTRPQEGPKQYLLVSNGASIMMVTCTDSNAKDLYSIDFDDVRVCGGKVYAILQDDKKVRKLYQLDVDKAKKMPTDPYGLNVEVMESYNGKLYLFGTDSSKQKLNRIVEYTPGGSYSTVNSGKLSGKNVKIAKTMVINNTMILLGKQAVGVEVPKEEVLYTFKTGTWNYALDVKSIDSYIVTEKGVYLKVKDFDRASAKSTTRNSVLFINNSGSISNAAIDFNITNQSVVGDSLIFAGANNITNRYDISSHDSKYRELVTGITVKYWNLVSDQVFAGGLQDKIQTLYSLTPKASKLVKKDFEVKSVLATKVPHIYLIYGIEGDKTSIYSGSKVLYSYNMQTNTFVLLTAGKDIEKIISY